MKVNSGRFADHQRSAVDQGSTGIFVDDAGDESLIGNAFLRGGGLNIH